MNERTKIKWKNVGDRTLATSGYGVLAITGPVLGPLIALARLRSVKKKAEQNGKTFTKAQTAKHFLKPIYQVSFDAISEIAEVYERGTEKLNAYDEKQKEIKEQEKERIAKEKMARIKAIEKAESPENLAKSPVGAIIECIREMKILGTRLEANVTDVIYNFNPKDNQIVTNKYIFQREKVLNKARAERNFMIHKRLEDNAVEFVIPEILQNLVSREIQKRIDQENELLIQKEMDAQRQTFFNALQAERQMFFYEKQM